MTLKDDRYTYRVTWSEDDNEYVGLCTEFPSLSWLAKEPETALKGIRKLVDEIKADLEKEGEPIPEPIALRHYGGQSPSRIMCDNFACQRTVMQNIRGILNHRGDSCYYLSLNSCNKGIKKPKYAYERKTSQVRTSYTRL